MLMIKSAKPALLILNRCPKTATLKRRDCICWLVAAGWNQAHAVTIVIMGNDGMRTLNRKTRDQNTVTDVLSFSADQTVLPATIGDIVLCYPKIVSDAYMWNIPLKERLAHLVIHGYLHLMGYSHDTKKNMRQMEALEVRALGKLDYPDPYQ